MIRFNNIRKNYGNLKIIHHLNLEITEGQFVVLVGPSGCGKTTTLKMINRLIEPSGGEIFIRDTNIMEMNPIELRRGIGYVIQQIGLFPNMTVEQNIAVVPKLLGWKPQRIQDRVNTLLELVDMPYDRYAKKYPGELSGGQQQRVGVLRALASEPPIILMDEPFGALDPITRDILQDEIKKLQQKLNITIIFVTHDMHEALKLADTIVFMHKGDVLQMCSPEELLRAPANDFVREFMGKHAKDALKNQLTARDFMKVDVLKAVRRKQTLECIELMRHRNVNTLVVTDDQGLYEGVVSIDDIRVHGKPGKEIGSFVNRDVLKANVEEDAKQVFDRLVKEKADYVVVLNDNTTVAGLITKTSMVKAMADALWGDLA